MTVRGVMATAWLLAVAGVQAAVVAVPAVLILCGWQHSSWMGLWDEMVAGSAPLAAMVAVVAALGPGSLVALALWRQRLGLVAGLLVTPLLMPVALLGSGENWAILLAGHASVGLALGALCGFIGLCGVDPRLLRAAASCGVSPGRAWIRVLLPLAAPGVLAGVVLANVASMALSLVGVAMRHPWLGWMGLTVSPASAVVVCGSALVPCVAVGVALALLRRG